FFFSSRIRHTRFSRDWSSDVCSSDLDCGLLLYDDDQEVFAGGSGPGCSAVVTYGHLLNQMKAGVYKKILFVATGALLSPLSVQQNETIPCIAHAIAIEFE